MKILKKFFGNRTFGFWLGLGVSLIALIADIAYVTAAKGDRNYSQTSFILILVGAILELAVVFTPFDFAILFPAILFSVGLGIHVYTIIPSLTDLFTKVNFYGGNQTFAIAFAVIFVICTLGAVVATFLNQRKKAAK